MAEQLKTINDLARQLHVEVPTIYEWRRRRQGPPAIRLGKYLRWRQCDIDAWIAEQAETAN